MHMDLYTDRWPGASGHHSSETLFIKRNLAGAQDSGQGSAVCLRRWGKSGHSPAAGTQTGFLVSREPRAPVQHGNSAGPTLESPPFRSFRQPDAKAKETINKKTTVWMGKFANDVTDKGLVSKIYKQLMMLKSIKTNNVLKKRRRPKQTFL